MNTPQASENSNSKEHFHLEYWVAIVRRRKRVFFIVAGIIMVVSIIGLLFQSPSYCSEFVIYFPDPQNPIIGGTSVFRNLDLAQGLVGGMGQQPPDLQQYAISILDSRTMYDKILDKYENQIFPDLKKGSSRVKLRDDLKRRILNIQVLPSKIIPVKVVTHDPQLSYDVARFYLDEYRKFEEKAMLTASKRKRVHLEEQKKIIEKKLNDAQYAMMNYQQSKRVVDLDNETAKAIESISNLKFYETVMKTEKMRSQEKLSAMREKMKKIINISKDSEPGAILYADPVISNLNTRLIQLKIQLIEEKKTKTDEHPDIVSLNDSISGIMEKLRKRIEEISNNVDVNLQADLVMAEIEYNSLDAQHRALENEISKASKTLEKYPDIRVSYNKFQKKIDSYQSILYMIEEEYEKARIEEEREGGQAQILDPPNMPEPSIYPTILYRIFLAAGYAFVIGLMAVFYVEYSHRAIDNMKISLKSEGGQD